jgi:hypothetical protein
MTNTNKHQKSALTENDRVNLKAVGNIRTETAIVRRYLSALNEEKPRRGRRKTAESVQRRMDYIRANLADANPLTKVHLHQELIDCKKELEQLKDKNKVASLERDFIQIVKNYSLRKSIGYTAWRASGVSASVLKKAGITRAKRPV